ncbi:MAG: hypothetical protein JSU07_14165 [Bacteroidetes bacterium]|nr:hypothetical protein [Bacteroidota bacterium]
MSQTNEKLLKEGDRAFKEKEWFEAAQYYNRLFNRDSSDLHLIYNYAEASRLNFDNDIALRLYNKIAGIDMGQNYPLSYYWMGQLYKNKTNYKEAKKMFTKFSKIKNKKKNVDWNYFLPKAKLEMEACELAPYLIKNPIVGVKVEHLDSTINSKVSEYAAFEADSALYFSSLRYNGFADANNVSYNKLYKSENRKSKWQKVKTLDTAINASGMHNANTCFSPDYKQMLVSRCIAKNGSDYTCNIYQSKLVNGNWSQFKKLAEPINTINVNSTQPCFGEINGKIVLFFASNRKGGVGGLDIWYSEVNDNGTFVEPVNCGKKINTPDDEITPWYVNEQKQLYFSSTYHKGLGGYDIFKSTYSDSGFTEPQNVGYPINSSYNDIYFSVNKDRNRAYLSSNRLGSYFESKLNCCNDIYRFNIELSKIEEVKPIDTLELNKNQMKLLVPLTLYFHNDEPDPKTKNITTDKNYELTYMNYKSLQSQYQSEFSKGLKDDAKTTALEKIDAFFTDSVDAGMEDLKRFAILLESVLLKGETVKITMKGYCSPLASTDYNINLAKRRISSLRNYFSEYKSGYFKKYIDNASTELKGKIIFENVDIGELPLSKVSDDYYDTRNSIYNPSAARERKIQIIAVSFGN